MSRVHGTDTTPEMVVRSFLHSRGFRFRLHASSLPGKPDIVLQRFRTVVLVNGCFWHHHPHCRRAQLPSSNSRFWKAKILGNRARDRANARTLRQLGWRVIVVWECATRKPARLRAALARLLRMRPGGSKRE